jgi:hypothetical protein
MSGINLHAFVIISADFKHSLKVQSGQIGSA